MTDHEQTGGQDDRTASDGGSHDGEVRSRAEDGRSRDGDEGSTDGGRRFLPLSRRNTMLTMLGLGAVGASGARAQAGPSQGPGSGQGGGRTWQTDVDGGGNTLYNLGGLAMADNPATITDFEGGNLTVDGQGVLAVDDGANSGLDADLLDGADLADLEAEIQATREFAEQNATAVASALTALEEWANSDLQNVQEQINGGLALLEGTLNALVGEVVSGFATVANTVEGLVNFLSTEVVAVVDGALGDVETALDDVLDVFENTLNPIADSVEIALGDVDSALTAVEDQVNPVVADVESAIESSVNGLLDPINTTINRVNTLISGGPDGPINNISDVSVDLGDLTIPDVGVSLPQASFSAPSMPTINEPPSVAIPDISIGEVEVGQIDIPEISLPKPTTSFDDFQP